MAQIDVTHRSEVEYIFVVITCSHRAQAHPDACPRVTGFILRSEILLVVAGITATETMQSRPICN
jgi:hypothetical protein